MKTLELGKRILFITAHPDDESYLLAGTMHENFARGGENILICATRGERGTSHLKKPLSAKQVKILRETELRKAAKFLRIKPLYILNFPDGSLEKYKKVFFTKSLFLAEKIKPDMVFGFGPDGITAHRDHIAAGIAARRVAKKIAARYFAVSLPAKSFGLATGWLATRRASPYYKNGVVYKSPSWKIKINKQAKLKAIGFHISQMDGKKPFSGFPKHVISAFMSAEYFVV